MESVKRAFKEYGKQKEFNSIKKFKDLRSYEDRKDESDRIREKYPTRIPVIVEPYDHNVPMIDRKKFLVPDDLSFANFIYVIRKRIKFDQNTSLYLFVNGKIMNTSNYLSSVYDLNKDEDGFLYVVYSAETTFG